MPPVSSLTTSRSVPSIRSRLSGEASYSAGIGLTGRRFAYRPRPLRRPSSPCSGRGAAGSVVSHLGPPTAASSTASAALHACRVSSVSAVPCRSIEAPPKGCSSNSKSPSLESSSTAGAMISGPIPSPGRVTSGWALTHCRHGRLFGWLGTAKLAASQRSQRRGRRRRRQAGLALRFVGTDRVLLAERHADVVQTLQQPPADLLIDLEGHAHQLAVGALVADLLSVQVHLPIPCRRQRPAVLFVDRDRQQPDLGAVGVEDVGEARPHDRLEAVVLQAPRRMLAGGPAAEVLAGHEDRVDRQGPVWVLGPVVEEELPAAGALHPLQELLGHDLVGVHVAAAEEAA